MRNARHFYVAARLCSWPGDIRCARAERCSYPARGPVRTIARQADRYRGRKRCRADSPWNSRAVRAAHTSASSASDPSTCWHLPPDFARLTSRCKRLARRVRDRESRARDSVRRLGENFGGLIVQSCRVARYGSDHRSGWSYTGGIRSTQLCCRSCLSLAVVVHMLGLQCPKRATSYDVGHRMAFARLRRVARNDRDGGSSGDGIG
jgi:hypothetical protein